MTARDLDDKIAATAAGQYNRFSRSQVLALGGSDDHIRQRRRSGRWISIRPGVYALPGPDLGFGQRLWEAHLAVGPASTVSHQAAGALQRVRGLPRRPLVLLVPHSGYHRIAGVTVHQISDLAHKHVITVDGLPTTDVTRTMVDLAAVIRSPFRLGVLLDGAVADRKTTYPAVGACLATVARRGKPGVRRLGLVLDERGPGHVPPATELEQAMGRALDLVGLPPPVRQFPFPGRQFTAGCTDSCYPDAKLILEADGRRWHTRIQDIKRDHERDNEAARHGYQTLRFLHEHLVADPTGSGLVVVETRARRLSNSTQ